MDKNSALREIMVLDFALLEIALFLDSHPNDKNALEDYKKYSMQLNEKVMAYTDKYGPLSHADMKNLSYWSWVKDPWPWENTKEEID